MWHSRTKNDLIIEVWEKLDCENVGSAEIVSIETVINDQYGPSAVDSPMAIGRLLAEEGAQFRHSELMELYLKRALERPYDAALRSLGNIADLGNAAKSIRKLENLRRKYHASDDKNGLRLIREEALNIKRSAMDVTERNDIDAVTRQINDEIVQWFTVWLQTPEVFERWVDLRQASADFIEKFGPV